jgi:hypothetical protein
VSDFCDEVQRPPIHGHSFYDLKERQTRWMAAGLIGFVPSTDLGAAGITARLWWRPSLLSVTVQYPWR